MCVESGGGGKQGTKVCLLRHVSKSFFTRHNFPCCFLYIVCAQCRWFELKRAKCSSAFKPVAEKGVVISMGAKGHRWGRCLIGSSQILVPSRTEVMLLIRLLFGLGSSLNVHH